MGSRYNTNIFVLNIEFIMKHLYFIYTIFYLLFKSIKIFNLWLISVS